MTISQYNDIMCEYSDFIEEQDLSWVYAIGETGSNEPVWYNFISNYVFEDDESLCFVPKGLEFWLMEEKVEYYEVEYNEKDICESEIIGLTDEWLKDFCAEVLKYIKQIKIENKLIDIEKDFKK